MKRRSGASSEMSVRYESLENRITSLNFHTQVLLKLNSLSLKAAKNDMNDERLSGILEDLTKVYESYVTDKDTKKGREKRIRTQREGTKFPTRGELLKVRNESRRMSQPPIRILSPDEIQACVICFEKNPPTSQSSQQDSDSPVDWLRCDICKIWAHEECAPEDSLCQVCDPKNRGNMRADVI